jgi:hypothetical protein
MKLSRLIKEYRRRADDRVTPGAYADDDTITEWFNEAENEACIRAHLLKDDVSEDLCVIALRDNVIEYPLDPRVLDVDTCRIPDRQFPLERADYEEIIYWAERKQELRAGGEPTRYAVVEGPSGFRGGSRFSACSADYHGRRLLIDRPPNIAVFKQLFLIVDRLPLKAMATPTADGRTDPEPEINRDFHYQLILWPLHISFDGRDQDRGDPQRAQNYEDRFEKVFGPRPNAATMRKRLRHRATVVAPDTTFRANGNHYWRRYRPRPDTP